MLPLPVPASVYGLVLLLLALNFQLIKLEDVKEVGTYLRHLPAAVRARRCRRDGAVGRDGRDAAAHPHCHHPGDGAGDGKRRQDHAGPDRLQKQGGRQ